MSSFFQECLICPALCGGLKAADKKASNHYEGNFAVLLGELYYLSVDRAHRIYPLQL